MSLHRDPFPMERYDNDDDFKGSRTPNVCPSYFFNACLYSFSWFTDANIYLSIGHQEGSASHPPGSLPGAMVALEREAYTKQHATPELLF